MEISIGTLLSLGSTTSTTNDGAHISNDEIATTLSTTVSTASTSGSVKIEVHAEAARDYVSTMSVEEIDKLLLEIDEQEVVLNSAGDQKVKKIGTIHNDV